MDKSDTVDSEMRRYLELEVPHYLSDSIQDIKAVGDFTFPLVDEIEAKMKVYEVTLGSGKKVFAVEGGWQGEVRNVYANELPDAETAAKVHLFTLAKLLE